MKKMMIASLALASIFLFASCTPLSSSSSTPVSSSVQNRVFTLVELAQYDGLNGNDAYFAVSGIVYDATNAPEWTNGSHKGMHLAGTDATANFAASPHTLSTLQTLPVVGTLQA